MDLISVSIGNYATSDEPSVWLSKDVPPNTITDHFHTAKPVIQEDVAGNWTFSMASTDPVTSVNILSVNLLSSVKSAELQ